MSCCNNPSNKSRSQGDVMMANKYCGLVENANTNMIQSNYTVREGYCSSCQAGTLEVMQSGYATLGSAYTTNQFPRPTGGKSCIQIQ